MWIRLRNFEQRFGRREARIIIVILMLLLSFGILYVRAKEVAVNHIIAKYGEKQEVLMGYKLEQIYIYNYGFDVVFNFVFQVNYLEYPGQILPFNTTFIGESRAKVSLFSGKII